MMNWIKNALGSPSSPRKRNNKPKAPAALEIEHQTAVPSKAHTTNSSSYTNSSKSKVNNNTNTSKESPLHLHVPHCHPKLESDKQQRSRSSSPTPAIIRERNVSSESLDTTAYATSSSVSLASQSNPGSKPHSRRNSGEHLHLPPTEDMLTDKAAFEDCVIATATGDIALKHNANTPSSSLSTVCERMSEDDLEDNKAFSDIHTSNNKTAIEAQLQQLETLGECDEEESEEADDEESLDEDITKNIIKIRHQTSYRASLGPMEIDDDPATALETGGIHETHLLNKRQLNEESLKDLIEALSTPEAWKKLQQEKHAMTSSRPRSSSSSLCNEHDPQPPTVDMLTDGMGFQELSPSEHTPLKGTHYSHIHMMNTVPERLIRDDLEDNRAFADISSTHRKSSSSGSSSRGSLNTVPERLSDDDLEDNRAFADVTLERQSSGNLRNSLNTVPERLTGDDLEDGQAFMDVRTERLSVRDLSVQSMGVVEECDDESSDGDE